jgi:hypothetical protein
VSGRQRIAVAAVVLIGVLGVVVLLAVASRACPTETELQPCPDAARNRALVLGLASVSVATLATPFAFLGEFVARRRIVYRGAWWRAARRGALVGLVLAALGGLRLGDALTVPAAIFTVLLAILGERFLAVRDRR